MKKFPNILIIDNADFDVEKRDKRDLFHSKETRYMNFVANVREEKTIYEFCCRNVRE
jgi:hypothetical protein